MTRSFISLLLSTIFLVFLAAPTIIVVVDNSIDVSIFYASSEEEENELAMMVDPSLPDPPPADPPVSAAKAKSTQISRREARTKLRMPVHCLIKLSCRDHPSLRDRAPCGKLLPGLKRWL